jgi:hypothetical protein
MPPRLQFGIGRLFRIVPFRFLFVLFLVLMCIVNFSWMTALYSRGQKGPYLISRIQSAALVFFPTAGAADNNFCACYSPSSSLNDITSFSAGSSPSSPYEHTQSQNTNFNSPYTVCGFDPSVPPSPTGIIVCKPPPLPTGDIICDSSPSLIDLQSAQAACGTHVSSSSSVTVKDTSASAPRVDVVFLSSRISKFGTSSSCRRLGLGCTSGQTHCKRTIQKQFYMFSSSLTPGRVS